MYPTQMIEREYQREARVISDTVPEGFRQVFYNTSASDYNSREYSPEFVEEYLEAGIICDCLFGEKRKGRGGSRLVCVG